MWSPEASKCLWEMTNDHIKRRVDALTVNPTGALPSVSQVPTPHLRGGGITRRESQHPQDSNLRALGRRTRLCFKTSLTPLAGIDK